MVNGLPSKGIVFASCVCDKRALFSKKYFYIRVLDRAVVRGDYKPLDPSCGDSTGPIEWSFRALFGVLGVACALGYAHGTASFALGLPVETLSSEALWVAKGIAVGEVGSYNFLGFGIGIYYEAKHGFKVAAKKTTALSGKILAPAKKIYDFPVRRLNPRNWGPK